MEGASLTSGGITGSLEEARGEEGQAVEGSRGQGWGTGAQVQPPDDNTGHAEVDRTAIGNDPVVTLWGGEGGAAGSEGLALPPPAPQCVLGLLGPSAGMQPAPEGIGSGEMGLGWAVLAAK